MSTAVSHGVRFAVEGPSREMHPIVRDEVYRITYEAIRNACMHSGGKHVNVELRYGRDLTVRIRDDGHGMDPDTTTRGKESHYGIVGMHERAVGIGAKLTLSSSPRSGTEVDLIVPGHIIFEHRKYLNACLDCQYPRLVIVLKRSLQLNCPASQR